MKRLIISAAYSDQSSGLFDKYSKCTCHYFVSQVYDLFFFYMMNVSSKTINKDHSNDRLETTNNIISQSTINVESCTEKNCILTVDDFCFWYDVRSALLDVIDRVVAMDETRSSHTEHSVSQSNQVHRRRKRPKTSIAIQTSCDIEQRRNAKVQANTVTLFPAQKTNLSSSNLFFN